MKKTIVDPKELKKAYEGITTQVLVEAEFTTEMIGGQPAGDKELAAFIQHHLKLEGAAKQNNTSHDQAAGRDLMRQNRTQR